MSNPGVLELLKMDLDNNSFRIEDNIGEAIHIHYGAMRIDLSVTEFYQLAEYMSEAIKDLFISKKINLSLDTINSNFLLDISKCLVDLKSAAKEKVCLDDLYVILKETNYELTKLTEFNIKQDIIEMEDSNIILFNDQNIIRNGITKALFALQKGENSIDVIRLNFYHNLHNIDYEDFKKQRIRFQKCCNIIRSTLEKLPENSVIAIRGAGEHTKKIMMEFPKNKKVSCIIEKRSDRNLTFRGYPIINEMEIDKYKINTIIIASFKYRKQIKKELEQKYIEQNIKIIDFYEYFEREGLFLKKAYYFVKLGGKWITL